jgi:O-acetyl-ADP-ribose deacetylase (regulator of RNase III)
MPATFIDRTDSIFDSGADVLVNPVNCVGVSGKGLALEFKKRFPVNQMAYEAACGRAEVTPDRPFYWWSMGMAIVNFPTKRHWRDASRLKDVRRGLVSMGDFLIATRKIRSLALNSIAIPALGCGLGGLDWKDVRPAIVEALRDIDGLTVYLYPPQEKA